MEDLRGRAEKEKVRIITEDMRNGTFFPGRVEA